jgi:hypothetical protein
LENKIKFKQLISIILATEKELAETKINAGILSTELKSKFT